MVQLVRANADFRNLTYLLPFPREPVEQALGPIVGASGRQFIEKIVQVSFDVPRIEPLLVRKLLFAEPDRILLSHSPWNSEKPGYYHSEPHRVALGDLPRLADVWSRTTATTTTTWSLLPPTSIRTSQFAVKTGMARAAHQFGFLKVTELEPWEAASSAQ